LKLPFSFRSLLPLLLLFPFGHRLMGQCTNKVNHVSGSAIVGTSNVTVTSAGNTANWTTYCPAVTSPFMIGYSTTSGSGPGSYTFAFSPSISGITLNFSGASNTGASIEEIRLSINGAHYPMAAPGAASGCDAMAILTGAGDLRGCLGCGVSGWSGTTISGFPISTLTVEDFVVGGTPNGSLFSLFICDVALSVEWLQLEAQLNNQGHTELNWSTAQEINSSHFVVERSQNGNDWSPIHQLDAAGNSTEATHYSFVDERTPSGQVYYRIVETSLDGATNESEIATVWQGRSNSLQLYPNPATEQVFIQGEFSRDAVVTLIDQLGKTVVMPTHWQTSGLEMETASLPRGVYCVRLRDGETTFTDKLILH
jgi:hypothetical protein